MKSREGSHIDDFTALAIMVKSKRVKTASRKKNANTEKPSEDLNQVLDSSDDDAPEEVTFGDSKNEALRSLKLALDSAKREKELLKEKRRKRQELFQEQKKRKLLPAEVLEEIESAPSKRVKESSGVEEDEAVEMKRKEKKSVEKQTRNLDGNYTVTTMKGGAAVSFQQKAAEDFIQSRLYGPGSCRTTNNQMLSLQNKRGSKKSAAVQFVKKDWALQQKAKAEKLKKRWIHKLQVPS
ncbi:Nucleolar protein 7 [Oryzias melastigma]|uniref:Nucleolar protein 7 n=1 Tax=Oryzias melastigma TaxID=30732 RepID=A0A834F0D4_ORYME|nr:Nucleolar protein 7 [Oryzias melastigma]